MGDIAYCEKCGIYTMYQGGSDSDLQSEIDKLRIECESFCPNCIEPWSWKIVLADEFFRDIAPRFAALAKSGECEHSWKKLATSENSPDIGQYQCSDCDDIMIGMLIDNVLHELPPPIAGLVLDHKSGIWSPPARIDEERARRIKDKKKRIREAMRNHGKKFGN